MKLILCTAIALTLAGCGGGGGGGGIPAVAPASAPAAASPVVADAATVVAVRPGVSPFIAFVDLRVAAGEVLSSAHYRIEPKPGSVSRPVDVDYAASYLSGRGYAASLGSSGSTVTVPVFGLYANYQNLVDIELQFADGDVEPIQAKVDTAAYTDPNGIYDRPVILKARTAGAALGFDFFYMKSALGSPVVVDTDGQMRWVVPATMSSVSSTLHGNGFVIGDPQAPRVRRLEFDGTTRDTALQAPDVTNFHHNIDPGKVGLLGEVDAIRNGVQAIESTLVEFDPDTGALIKTWDLGDTLSRAMQAAGDDPAAFVRPGVDWFHMNAATYDPRDDSVIVSSRENFVLKIDYASGDLLWILGDPAKYWHTFPSLEARSLTLGSGGLYPIGQHAVSIAHDGSLMLMNDGLASVNQPAGAPAGEARGYSAVSAYTIDAAGRGATEATRFDYGQSVFSSVCSSAYEAAADGSVLVDYAVADNTTHARLVGLDPGQNVVFDFEYPTTGCNTSWNAQPISFDAMRFQ